LENMGYAQAAGKMWYGSQQKTKSRGMSVK
jgi:hypothetical protein